MSLHKTRSINKLQHILSSFRQFEKKLDKLQDDVSYQGQTLTDLRVMIAKFSGSTLSYQKADHVKAASKTTAVDCHHFEEAPKTKRKSIQPLSSPFKVVKSHQGHMYGLKYSKEPEQFGIKKMASAPKSAMGVKRVPRQGKGGTPRKENSLRMKKASAKKSKSPPRSFEYPNQIKRPLF